MARLPYKRRLVKMTRVATGRDGDDRLVVDDGIVAMVVYRSSVVRGHAVGVGTVDADRTTALPVARSVRQICARGLCQVL